MKLLRQYIRGTLLAESIHPKIAGMIDQLEELMAYKDGKYQYKIIIDGESGSHVFVELRKILKKRPDRAKEIGKIEASTYGSDKCLGALIVDWASVTKTAGEIGPLLYDITMEAASQWATGLTCDRDSLSEDAFSVWNKYLNMRCKMKWNRETDQPTCTADDIEIKQLDHLDWPETPPKEDDCRANTSEEYYAAKTNTKRPTAEDHDEYMDYFHYDDPLSKVYIKKDPAVIRRLSGIIEWINGKPGWAE